MAMNEKLVYTESFIAGEDLSDYQYHGVAISGEMTVDACDADTDQPIGILLNDPESGEMANVLIIGRTPIVAGEAIPVGSRVRIDSNGHAMVFDIDTDVTTYCIGTCVNAAGAAAEKAEVMVTGNPWKGEE